MRRLKRNTGLCGVSLILAMWLSLNAFAVKADTGVKEADEAAELSALHDHLAALTSLATKTFLNADHVPGMVSVLYGDELSAMGIRTVGESLELISGVYLSHQGSIYWKTVIRGVPRSYTPGALKFLLNGAPISSSFGIDAIPNMPIDQVERIEMIRGPGSAVHGEFAFAGVMNIITRAQGSRISIGTGTHDLLAAGAVLSYHQPVRKLNINLNVQEYRIAGADIHIGPGILSSPKNDDSDPIFQIPDKGDEYPREDIPSPSTTERYTDEPFNQERTYRSGIASLNYDKFALNAHLLENGQQGLYDTRHWGISSEMKIPIQPSINAKLSLGLQKQHFDSLYSGYYTGKDFFSPGWIYGFTYNERIFFGGAELYLANLKHHRILLGYHLLHSDLDDIISPENPYTVFHGYRRTIHSLLFQDEIQIHDRFIVTAGVRYDKYNDIGSVVSPRIAGVFRLTPEPGEIRRQLIKFQYARAFRPPTFLEIEAIHQTWNIDEETIDTWEAAYLVKHDNTAFRVTGFYSNLKARIDEYQFSSEPGRFNSLGLELELETKFYLDKIRLSSNAARIWTENRDTGRKIGESAQWLANISLRLGPFYGVSLYIHERIAAGRQPLYNGDSEISHQPRDYAVTDISLNIASRLKGLKIQGGVKNLFKADIRSQEAEQSLMHRQKGITHYESGNLYPERGLWVKLIYEF